MINELQLGISKIKTNMEVEKVEPTSVFERISILEDRIDSLTRELNKVNETRIKESRATKSSKVLGRLNKDGLPIGSCLKVTTPRGLYILIVGENEYAIGNALFSTIELATLAVTNSPVNVGEFWQTLDGKPLKDFAGGKWANGKEWQRGTQNTSS